MAVLYKRLVCDQFGNCTYSDWDYWIRWVVIGVVILLFLLTFFLCSCSNARYRRRRGQAPYYGTGWAARPFNREDPYYRTGIATQAWPPPPPQYSAGVPDGHTQWGAPPQREYEMYPPAPTYPGPSRGGDVWSPPEGPPPKKGDILR